MALNPKPQFPFHAPFSVPVDSPLSEVIPVYSSQQANSPQPFLERVNRQLHFEPLLGASKE